MEMMLNPEMKKENSKQLKKKKIIDAASILFSRKSYHEVMIEEVAKLASIAKGTVYNYFSSKEELYFSIMQGRMEKLNLSLKESISVHQSRSEEHTSELQSLRHLVCRLLLEKK